MKIKTYNQPALKRIRQASLLGVVLITLAGCTKDKTPDTETGNAFDGSTVKYVLNDNFNFGIAYEAFSSAKLIDTLAKPGPYTVLASDNGSFQLVGIAEPLGAYSFQFYSEKRLVDMMRYSVIPGKISFRSIPLVQNKPLLTATGGKVYLSKYLNGTDTVITINGVKLTSVDNAASNGYIQALPQILNAETYRNALDYMHSDTTISLYAAALHRANLDVSVLSGSDVYTIIAPSNVAMQQSGKLGKNLGLSTLDSILDADPAKLAGILKYHLIKGRYFEGDLYRDAAAHPEGITTVYGSKVSIGGNPAGFHAITFTGNGNNGIASSIAIPKEYNLTINYANIPCGNAVIHIVDRVLIP